MAGLRKLIDAHRNLTEHDASGECFLTSDTPDLPSSSIELMSTWLASAGVRVLGSDVPRTHCSVAPSPLMADDASVTRSDFSESWLWRLAAIGTNGSVMVSARAPDSISRFEASAFCLAKNGVSVSQPAVLQVFREFFIHADGPRRLRRGDTAIIPYRIFNYLYQAISMKVQISTDSGLNSSTSTETVCIQPRSSIAKRLEVSARQNGAARLRIKASTVRDHLCTNDTSGKDVSDEVVIRIDIDHEGVPAQEHKSAMLCAKDIYSLKRQPVVWKWSQIKAVPGTESVTVWAAGNTIAPLLADADALVQLPRGCGEQNMARLATNLLALFFLEPTSTPAAIAKDHVARGFTRQLQYVHPSGGFSAFGAADPSASTWLTAFCVRYLRKAYKVISGEAPVPPAILQAEQWLRAQQMENGCFRNQGHVFHHELKGGLDEEGEISSVALTAYVITSLLETAPLSSELLKNTLSCLRALPPSKSKSKVNPLRIYAHSIITYSLMRLRRYEEEVRSVNEAFLRVRSEAGLEQDEELRELLELLRMAKRTEDYVWWETGNLATSVEATGYALLALWECPPALRENCAADVAGATRWLATHRNAAGGFISTQDTLVALEGLSRWSTLLPPVNNVTVTIQSGTQRKQLHLDAAAKLPETAKVPVTDQLRISVEGTGCALVQATRFYNTLSELAEQQNSLTVQVNAQTDGAFNCDHNAVCFCAAVVEACVVWAGPFPEMALLEVGLPGGFGADAAALYSQLQLNDTLLRRIELSPNSGKATLYLGTRDGSDTVPRAGNQCYKIHAVGPKARTKPAHAKVLDYYRPHIKDTQMYTIPEDCPSRIAHDTSNYLKSDNLFNRAKSLTDSEEILITHEFSFEDIPEGIPLEDPLYDNLTKRNQNENTKGHTNVKNQVVNIEDNIQYKNNITNEIRQNESIRDENEILKEDEHVTNAHSTNININNTKDDRIQNESIKDENQIIKENEYYFTNIGAVITGSKTNTDIETNKRIHDETRLKESVTDENEIPKENNYTTNISTFMNKMNNHGSDNVNIVTTNDYENLVTKEINTTIDMQNESKVSNEVIRDTASVLLGYNKNDVKEEQKLHNTEEKLAVNNPSFTNFHVIDSEKDLDLPTGIEGPIPAIVLPPKNFVAPQDIADAIPTWRRFSDVAYNPYSNTGYQRPYYYKQNYYN